MKTKIAIACQGGGSRTAFNLFPAVQLDGDALWDRLFSDNPPLDDLVRPRIVGGAANLPNELWIIKINPTMRASAPVEPHEIADRRNQLEGNVSVFQNLKWIELINDLIMENAFRPDFLASWAHGEERGRAFLAERALRVGAAGTGLADQDAGPRRRK